LKLVHPSLISTKIAGDAFNVQSGSRIDTPTLAFKFDRMGWGFSNAASAC
jgi:hypothetical protein